MKIKQGKKKKICAVYREDTGNGQTCQKLFTKFYVGYFSWNNDSRSDRPVEINNDHVKI